MVAITTIATSWTTPPSGFWNWTVVTAFRTKGNYSTWLDQKQARLESEQKVKKPAPRP